MELSGRTLAIHLTVLLVLLCINALVSAGEIAFVSLNQQYMNDLALEDNKRAKKVLQLTDEPDDLISSLQSTITLTEVIASVYFSVFFFEQLMQQNFVPVPSSLVLQLILIILILTTVFIVLGEKLPKRIAAIDPDKSALRLVNIVSVVSTIIKPYVWLVNGLTKILQKLIPIQFNYNRERFTRDEMQAILVESHSEGTIDIEEYTMLEGVLSLDEKIAKEIMVPRTDTQMINNEDDVQENIDEILESPYSRIPIYEGDRDNIIGILHAKSLLKLIRHKDESQINLLDVSFDPLFVPVTMYIDDLLVEFKRQQQHMAILIDEYGGVEGIVTMEDLLEEIVGEIDDENDVERMKDIKQIDLNNAIVNAGIDIEDFNQYYNLSVIEEDIETLAGAITREIGYVPSSTERIKLRVGNYVIHTLRVESGRIYSVKITADPARSLYTDYTIDESEEKANA